MKAKKVLVLLLALAMTVSLFAACGGKEDDTPAEKTKIFYWHTYTDQHEEKLLEIIDAFNKSQNEYELVAEQQPYSEIDSKVMQSAVSYTHLTLPTT